MSLSVDYLYSFSLNLIRKNQSGGLSSDEFNNFWNDAQSSYMDDMLGRFQARNNGKTGTNTGLIQDETIFQKLSPFIKTATITITSPSVILKPTDFLYRLGFRINGYDVYKIDYNQISNVNNDLIDTPSVTNNDYYFVEYQGYYSILPATLPTVSITQATLDYVSEPTPIKWGYTFDSDGRQIYNSGTSVQPLWDNNSSFEITKRMLTTIGVSFKDADFEQFGKSVVVTGE